MNGITLLSGWSSMTPMRGDLDDDIAAATARFDAKLIWKKLHRLRDDLQAELGQ